MGVKIPPQGPQACIVDLEARVRANHPLRRVNELVDFSFAREQVVHLYGQNGNPSIDPVVTLKLMFLLFFYDIPSERELLDMVPERLDFLWFLGYGLDEKVPDHSVPSKARSRWGPALFGRLFLQVVAQCVQAGLVDGKKLHVDSSLVRANAAKDSVLSGPPELIAQLRQACEAQLARLGPETAEPARQPPGVIPLAAKSPTVPAAASEGTEPKPEPQAQPPSSSPEKAPAHPVPEAAAPGALAQPAPAGPFVPQVLPAPEPEPVAAPAPGPKAKPKEPVNATHFSPTDPQATLVKRGGASQLYYKSHRGIDDAYGVITAVVTSTGIAPDGPHLPALVAQHQSYTGCRLEACIGDSHYGTAENYRLGQKQGWQTHLAPANAQSEAKGFFPVSHFAYDGATDRYRCPAGHYLRKERAIPWEQWDLYRIEQAHWCARCPLQKQCTQSAHGRTLTRPWEADLVEAGQEQARSPAGRAHRRRRRYRMEGSFADGANNHGLKRARWRGLQRQSIQDYLIAVAQNVRLLLRHGPKGSPAAQKSRREALRRKNCVLVRCLPHWWLCWSQFHPEATGALPLARNI